jgi:hypothetical protein
MKIPCSSCNQRLEIPEELAGQTIECPSCKASLAVPAIEVPPPATPQIRVTAPQAAKPQKPSPRRQTSAAPKAASSKKSKSPIPKWVIAAVAGVVVVVLMLVIFSGPQPPDISIGEAALYGNIKAVKQHLAAGTDVNDPRETDDNGTTPLHFATFNGHKEVAELLIANGANVNALDGAPGGRKTSLHGAAVKGRKGIVRLLIAKSADVNAKNDKGNTPLDLAVEYDKPETAALLRKYGGKTGEELKAKP